MFLTVMVAEKENEVKVLTPEPLVEAVPPRRKGPPFLEMLLKVVAWGAIADLSVKAVSGLKEAFTRKSAGGSKLAERQKPPMRPPKPSSPKGQCQWHGNDRLRPISAEQKQLLENTFESKTDVDDLADQVERYRRRDLRRSEKLRAEFFDHLPPIEEFLA